ncbi:LCP family protein [Paenibacillus tarimensis]|uniref:LCP family protein n=1 Tax=Paenibacillus tarimensis TaxID=416012 RepID=UPI001F383060|nr:LCP family protein [Paenibacillus tarimensis]MCF2944957.1 LCP family protein [Paenibacillus tarimensis]
MKVRAEKKKRPWKWALYSILGVAIIIGAYAAYQGIGIYNALDNFKKSDTESRFKDVIDVSIEKPPEWTGTERVNILLLGGDARGLEKGQVARSDSMMVASIDPITKKAHLLSLLRDTYVEIPGHSSNRINTAITLGGPPLAMQTVGDLLGLDIQYYIYADFEGFKALVDAIGGVDYEVEKDMVYTDNADKNRYDINLKKGYQHLDGDKALQYVRFRHDAMSDFTRTERQRNFLNAVATKMQSTWNLVRMKEILDSVQPFIETNLEVNDMLKLGQLGLGLHMAGSAQLPPMDLLADERIQGVGSVLGIRDTEALKAYVQEVLNEDTSIPESVKETSTQGSGASGIESSGDETRTAGGTAG